MFGKYYQNHTFDSIFHTNKYGILKTAVFWGTASVYEEAKCTYGAHSSVCLGWTENEDEN